MKTLIISGGNIDFDFALDFMKRETFDFVIAADRGVEFLRRAEITPDRIIGDFDSCDKDALEYFADKGVTIRRLQPQKDSTDTEVALQEALALGSAEICLLGATGTRLDHVLGNIRNLSMAQEAGAACTIVDAHNRIRLLDGAFTLKKAEQFGKYVSLLAFGAPVRNLTLQGFFYPLNGYTMTCEQAVGVSNELVAEEGRISFSEGRLLMIESRD